MNESNWENFPSYSTCKCAAVSLGNCVVAKGCLQTSGFNGSITVAADGYRREVKAKLFKPNEDTVMPRYINNKDGKWIRVRASADQTYLRSNK